MEKLNFMFPKNIKYCPECGISTKHKIKYGVYAASPSYEICVKCGHKEEISTKDITPDFMKLW